MNVMFSSVSAVVIAFVTSLWMVVFLEKWKKKEAAFACKWDTIDCDNDYENTRPDYVVSVRPGFRNYCDCRKKRSLLE